jgi:hypothetical protein
MSNEQPNIFLTGDELETITGFFGEMLDDNTLDDQVRRRVERVYKKAAIELGVLDEDE